MWGDGRTVQSAYFVLEPRASVTSCDGTQKHLLFMTCLILNLSLITEFPENSSVFPQPPHSAVWCGVGMGCNQSKELGLGVTPYTDTVISPLSIHSNIYPLFLFNKHPLRKSSLESQDLSGAPGSQRGNQKAHALRSWIEGYESELSAKTPGERPK